MQPLGIEKGGRWKDPTKAFERSRRGELCHSELPQKDRNSSGGGQLMASVAAEAPALHHPRTDRRLFGGEHTAEIPYASLELMSSLSQC